MSNYEKKSFKPLNFLKNVYFLNNKGINILVEIKYPYIWILVENLID